VGKFASLLVVQNLKSFQLQGFTYLIPDQGICPGPRCGQSPQSPIIDWRSALAYFLPETNNPTLLKSWIRLCNVFVDHVYYVIDAYNCTCTAA